MPNVLVRGHMRFDDNDIDKKKSELKSQINELEQEINSLYNKLDESLERECIWELENKHLKDKSILISNRRAKRDSLVNSAISFEKDIATSLQNNHSNDNNYSFENRQLSENETITHIRNKMLNMIVSAQREYPDITLERIFHK